MLARYRSVERALDPPLHDRAQRTKGEGDGQRRRGGDDRAAPAEQDPAEEDDRHEGAGQQSGDHRVGDGRGNDPIDVEEPVAETAMPIATGMATMARAKVSW